MLKDLSNRVVIQRNENHISYLQFKILNDLGVKHAYTLKNDGVNFRHSEENFKIELESYKKICNALAIDSKNITKPKQNHTSNVKIIDNTYAPEELENIDGLITNKKNIILSTTNADCILYLLFDRKKRVIGNIHSGWKGSYKKIIEAALDKMINDFNCDPRDIIVCICPSIRKCCFEVEKDVKDMFYEKFSYLENINNYIFKKDNTNKYLIDTVGINNCLIRKKGIPQENIYDCNICSMCNKDIIHSYRAEGEGYKLATAIITL